VLRSVQVEGRARVPGLVQVQMLVQMLVQVPVSVRVRVRAVSEPAGLSGPQETRRDRAQPAAMRRRTPKAKRDRPGPQPGRGRPRRFAAPRAQLPRTHRKYGRTWRSG
jgi:hypothetical protein